MKKFIMTMVISLMTIFSVNAQIATENSKLFDNVYTGVEVGATTPFDFNSVFPLNTVVGVKFGKEFTPTVGLEVEGQAFFNENNYARWTNTFVKGTNVVLNGVINWTNVFAGYNGTPRFFEVKSNTGLGWLHRLNNNGDNALSAKTALDFAFNFGKTKAHTFTVTPGVWWVLGDNGSKIEFNKNHAQFGVFASYTYHFKTSNGTRHFKTYDVGAMMHEIDYLNAELSKKPTEVEVVKYVDKVVNNTNTNTATNTVIVNATDVYVFFAYDSTKLDARAKEELNKLGQNGIYCVDAWASNEGSTDYNLGLSQRRADAVKTYLESRGCKIESAVGHGVQFGNTTGRVAVVTSK